MDSTTNETPAPAPAGNGSKDARITTSFLVRNTQSQLAATISNIIVSLTGNAFFASPSPTLAVITAAREDYVAKMDAAAGGGKLLTAQLADARVVLVDLMRSLALDLQKASGGDRTRLVSTGFPLRKQRSVSAPLAAPGGMRLTRGGNSGQLIVRCRTNRRARAYQWRYATAQAPTAWTETGTTTQSHSVIEGLVPGTQYVAEARCIGPQGSSDWSDSVAMFAT